METATTILEDRLATIFSHAQSQSCAEGAEALLSLASPVTRFQLLLHYVLPALEAPNRQMSDRILAAYTIYISYTPYPISLNPFLASLQTAFNYWRKDSLGGGSSYGLTWVLWKIIQEKGNEAAKYSPASLSQPKMLQQIKSEVLSLKQIEVNANGSQNGVATHSENASSLNEDAEQNSRALSLLRAARERVLSLSEQRLLVQLLPKLPPPLVSPSDLPAIVKNNAQLAHPLIVALLSNPPESMLQERDYLEDSLSAYFEEYLATLSFLPPTLPTFDLFGRLLRDKTPITLSPSNSTRSTGRIPKNLQASDAQTILLSELVHKYSLGAFLANSIRAIDTDAEDGTPDAQLALAVRHLSRFALSLLRMKILDPTDAACAELAHFALNTARFDDARVLYGALIQGQTAGG